MTWLLLWLEVLGIMAAVFAAGIGIGFFASWCLRPKKRRPIAPARHAVTAPTESYIAPGPVTTEPPPPEPFAETAHEKAPEAIAPAPSVEPSLQTVPYGPIVATMRFPLNSFGRVSITRPDGDQLSS